MVVQRPLCATLGVASFGSLACSCGDGKVSRAVSRRFVYDAVLLSPPSCAAEIPHTAEVVVAPPFLYLLDVHRFLLASRGAISASAQDCRVGGNGAFTGDVTADMLSDAGVPWVIVGHSERRTLHGETDQEVESKIRYAMSKGLAVIACIGETLEEREGGRLEEVLARQLAAVVRGVGGGERWARAVIAYEPVWAIGTGKVASPEQAQETHAFLRETLAKQLAELDAPATLASTVRIIYGGSVNAGNAATLAALQDVDGFLVGGASLKADSFIDIVVAGASQN